MLAGAGVAWAVDADLQGLGGRGRPAASPAPSVGALAMADPSTGPAAPEPSPQPTAVGIDLARYSTTDPASLWVVVNKQHAVDPVDYAPTGLVWVDGGMVRGDVAPDLRAMIAAAKADGVRLSLRNGYRSYRDQMVVHGDVVDSAGAAYADAVSARPGYSEHQTGLALDLHSASRPGCDLAPCFAGTAEAAWVAAHAWEHGFLVRYTPQNSAATGYAPEAWHLRYVGPELATWMHATGVTSLEEAFGVNGGPDYAAG